MTPKKMPMDTMNMMKEVNGSAKVVIAVRTLVDMTVIPPNISITKYNARYI